MAWCTYIYLGTKLIGNQEFFGKNCFERSKTKSKIFRVTHSYHHQAQISWAELLDLSCCPSYILLKYKLRTERSQCCLWRQGAFWHTIFNLSMIQFLNEMMIYVFNIFQINLKNIQTMNMHENIYCICKNHKYRYNLEKRNFHV